MRDLAASWRHWFATALLAVPLAAQATFPLPDDVAAVVRARCAL